MSFASLYKFVLFVGFASLLHSAYSAAQHRTYLRITEQEFTWLPFDILVQAIVSLSVVIYTILQVVGDFREIRATVDLQAKTWETLANIPSFYTFNHRGKSLCPDYHQPSPNSDKMDWVSD